MLIGYFVPPGWFLIRVLRPSGAILAGRTRSCALTSSVGKHRIRIDIKNRCAIHSSVRSGLGKTRTKDSQLVSYESRLKLVRRGRRTWRIVPEGRSTRGREFQTGSASILNPRHIRIPPTPAKHRVCCPAVKPEHCPLPIHHIPKVGQRHRLHMPIAKRDIRLVAMSGVGG